MFGLLKKKVKMSAEKIAKTWQSKRIDAINRKIARAFRPAAIHEVYMDEYERVYRSECKTKKEYKIWIQKNGRV
jgi:hypothetical protein